MTEPATHEDTDQLDDTELSLDEVSPVGVSHASEALWQTVEQICTAHGVLLYDVDVPTKPPSLFRVYVTKLGLTPSTPVKENALVEEDESVVVERTGVTLDECSAVARDILDLDEKSPFIIEGCNLEVTSPGINRRLRRPEHFTGAIGERVRIKYLASSGRYEVAIGIVQQNSTTTNIFVAPELVGRRTTNNKNTHSSSSDTKGAQVAHEAVEIKVVDIKEARVDFRFD